MAQKKRKPSKQSSDADNFKKEQIEYEKRKRAFQSDRLFQERLLMEDVSSIRTIAEKYNECEQITLYSYLLSSFLVPPNSETTARDYLAFLLEMNREDMMLSFASAVVEIISGQFLRVMYPQEFGVVLSNFGKIRKRLISRIPKEFLSTGGEPSGDTPRFPFAHPLDSVVSTSIDWQKIFQGDNLCLWANKSMKILQSVLPESVLDSLNSEREKLILALASDIGDTAHQRFSFLSEKFSSLSNMLNILDFNVSPFGQQILSKKLDSGFQNFPPILLAVLCNQCLYDLMLRYSFNEAAKRIWEETPAGVLPYTTLSLLSLYKSSALCPLFVQSLTFAMTRSLFEDNPHQFDLFEGSARKISIRTDVGLSVPESYWKKIGFSASFEDEGFSITLAQIAHRFGNIIPPHQLDISTRWEHVLETLGLSRAQAYVFCGYLEGAASAFKSGNINPHEKMTISAADVNDTPSLEYLLAQSREQAKNEVSEAMQEAETLRERAEVLERRSKKEIRSAQHDVDVLSARNSALEDELKAANEALKKARAERKELQQAVLDLSAQMENSSDEPEIDLKANFPSEIGKTCRFVVVGGPQNWVAEQSKRFPYILFYNADNRPDEAIIKGADVLMVNTFVLTHKYFDMIQDVAGKAGLPLHYFAYKGINRGSEAIISTYNNYVAKTTEERD